jgi:hypothetical protein
MKGEKVSKLRKIENIYYSVTCEVWTGRKTFRSRHLRVVCVCVCVCGGGGRVPVSECPLESSPIERELPAVFRRFSSKRSLHSKTRTSLGKNKNMIMVPEGTRNQDWLCWWKPAAVYTADRSKAVGNRQVAARSLFSSKRRSHFKTHKWSCNEQKYGHGSRQGPKSRMTVLAKAISKLLLCSRDIPSVVVSLG